MFYTQGTIQKRFFAGAAVCLLVLAAAAQVCCGAIDVAELFYNGAKPPQEPTLFAVAPADDNRPVEVDANFVLVGQRCLVVATHGWFERDPWPKNLATAIQSRVDVNPRLRREASDWLCGYFDWRTQARSVNPTDAAKYARDVAGSMLANKILHVSKDFRHVHLIGHSAGCWLIDSAAKRLANETHASIHLTFLDAYVPPGWDERQLGDFNEPNLIYWADHYLTRDITLKMTERWLTHAHNVDISDITPGLKDHEFPRYWYPATVLGKYVPGDRYDGKQLFYKVGDTDYGFARSLESGQANWKQSLTLPCGNEAVKLNKRKDL